MGNQSIGTENWELDWASGADRLAPDVVLTFGDGSAIGLTEGQGLRMEGR